MIDIHRPHLNPMLARVADNLGQELTTELGANILMSEATARRAGSVARLRSLGLIEVRGRAEAVEVFSADMQDPRDPISAEVAESSAAATV